MRRLDHRIVIITARCDSPPVEVESPVEVVLT
jgi:hypothetical protein